jgi:CheY-like chemotaxis protein
MTAALRVLVVEDSDDDAILLVRALRRDGFAVEFERVETPAELESALNSPWDLVISDYRMPSFNGLAALAVVRRRNATIPFVIVSATIDEHQSRLALESGAFECLSKHDLGRVAPAIRRCLRPRS